MKMNRREFLPHRLPARLWPGAKLATGKTPVAETQLAASTSIRKPGVIRFRVRWALKNVRLGVEIDGAMHWVDESAHVDWSGAETGESTSIEFTRHPSRGGCDLSGKAMVTPWWSVPRWRIAASSR